MKSKEFDDFVQFLREDTRCSHLVHLKKIHQKLYSCEQLWDKIPEDFKKKWLLNAKTFIGIEWCEPGDFLALHTDIGGRKSNLLLNIGKHPATIQHSNADVVQDQTIEPGEFFVIDTTKEHGCDNTKNTEKAEFLTINYRMSYSECIAQF